MDKIYLILQKSTDLLVTDTHSSKTDSWNEKLTFIRRLKELVSIKKNVKPIELGQQQQQQ